MSATRPRVLDLFCGAGGASAGYALAGFEVVGVDLAPQPRYPFEFHQANALEFPLDGFDLIHASPPCQLYSTATAPARSQGKTYPDLVAPVRERLHESGTPYVIENVPKAPLINAVTLCGAMFGLQVYRHRLFEASFLITPPPHPKHVARCAGWAGPPEAGEWMTVLGESAGHDLDAAMGAMGAWWMNGKELSESIPPPYSFYVGRAFLQWARVRNSAGDPDGGVMSTPSGTLAEFLTQLPDPNAERLARERALAAECSRRYRARQQGATGKEVEIRKPGPKAGKKSIALARRRYEAAELARLRTLQAITQDDRRLTTGD